MRRIHLILLLIVLLAVPAMADYTAGVAAYNAKSYDEAVTQFQEAIEGLKVAGAEEDPQYAAYYLMLGHSLSKAGKLKEAIAPLKTALKMNGDDVGAQITLGQTHYKLKNYSECGRVLGDVDASPLPKATQGAISNMLSVCYDKSGKSGLALANMEKAAQLNPDDAAAQFNYGTKALGAGYTDDAVKYLERAVALEGSDAIKRRAYTTALVRKGRETTSRAAKKTVDAKAVVNTEQLTKMDPSYDNYLVLAETKLGAQQYEGATQTLDIAIGKKSSDWLPYFYMGQAFTALGQYQNAVDPLTSSLSKRPGANDKARVDKQLGFVYEKLKQYEKSMAHYQACGDSAGFQRVEENFNILQENRSIDSHNAEVQELERQKKALEEKMKALPGGAAPPSN